MIIRFTVLSGTYQEKILFEFIVEIDYLIKKKNTEKFTLF